MNPILESLNPSQRSAVETIHGPLMTLAGPGSGKTRVVTHRIAYMIDQGIPSTSILAMTFTNKAAGAIRERVQRLVGNRPITMGTFHGFGARFLRRYGRSIGLKENFSIYDPDDAKKALEVAIIKSKISLSHTSIGDIVREISRLKNNLITPEMMDQHRLSSLEHIVYRVYPAYQQQLIESSAVDFDDLLFHTANILRSEPDLRSDLDQRYEYILVDEYQDTNSSQYMIVKLLSIDHPNLNVTGDPDQSIYGWRGANIENILSFEKDFPQTKVVRLEQNYRSTPEILGIADSLIQHNRRRKAKNLLPTRDSGTKVRLVHYADDRAEAENIIDQIRTAVVDNGESPRDFAILYRTNAQSRLLEKELIKNRMNYQLIGGFRFYHRQEIKDLLAYLRLVMNADDDVAFNRIINTPTRGLGDKTLSKVAEIASRDRICMLSALVKAVDANVFSKKAADGANQFLKLYGQLVELSRGSIVDILNHLIESTKYLDHLAKKKADDDEDDVDSNILELLADAKQVDLEFGDDNPLQIFLEQVSLLADSDQLENDPDRVTLMTLHASKGLEFPSVFIIAVEHDILPHARSKEDPAQLEEERRLLFVGMTRAEDRLQLSTARRRGFQNRTSVPSQFLFEIPRLELEVVDMSESTFEAHGGFGDSDFGDSDFSDTDFGDSESVDNDPTSFEFGANQSNPFADDDSAHEISENAKNQSFGQAVRLPQDLEAKLNKLRKLPTAARMQSAANLAPLTTAGGVDLDLFRVGLRAVHPNYGEGKIIALDGHGAKRRAIVRFDIGETKTFVLASSKLTVS